MRKLPFEHRIIKPFEYTKAVETDVAKTIKRAREALKQKPKPTNVQPLRKKVAA